MKVGFIGLGIMGRPMARNLLKAGFSIMVSDVNEEAVDDLVKEGAEAGSYREIGEKCRWIVIMVPSGVISKSIIFGDCGLATQICQGTIICDMSSVSPAESRECYDKLKEIGVGFVDAPVSGGEEGAIKGSLAIMAGGDRKHFDELSPLFEAVGNSASYIGPSGSGSIAKLANQVIVNNTIAVVSEAFVLAAKAGADPEAVYNAVRGGLAASAVLDAKIPKILARDFKAGGPIRINLKDIKNVMETAHDLDVSMPYTAQLFEIMRSLKVHGRLEEDHASIAHYFEELSDCEIKRL